MPNIRELLQSATESLADLAEPRFEAELLLAEALNQDRTYLHTWPERCPDDKALLRFNGWLARRVAGEPIAYILGHREFWSLDLQVNEHCLIPRHDTELLVETTLATLDSHAALAVAELGTGSGAIALALASECPTWQITAADIDLEALKVAKTNAEQLQLSNVSFHQSNWCQQLQRQQFHAIVSNPPYLADDDPHLFAGDLPYEPRHALAAGEDGLDAIRQIARQARDYLQDMGWLLLEHGWQQGQAVQGCLAGQGYEGIKTLTDLNDLPRVTIGRFCSNP
ncbi:MAG: protein-(glutamine-N5) methyltransferase, release factor-specific [Legionellales bacterium]|nr:protein-(glutamine-N5) methyltransferase, release factor-specific [Legionellales bacterium]|tara:strand:- start:5489 stop:6334 length:846 start_codon:yes stop_codon:yes gene_type:complete